MLITRAPGGGSPDMILTAFDVKFNEKKDVIPPGACRPSKSEETKQCAGYGPNKVKKKQCGQSGFPARPSVRPSGGSGRCPFLRFDC